MTLFTFILYFFKEPLTLRPSLRQGYGGQAVPLVVSLSNYQDERPDLILTYKSTFTYVTSRVRSFCVNERITE